MNTDLKKYLRTNERLATIVAAEFCTTLAGGTVFCVAFEFDGGGMLGDHFNVAGSSIDGIHEETRRGMAFDKATITGEHPPSRPLVGKQVIVVLDDQGNPEGYRPPLAHPVRQSATG